MNENDLYRISSYFRTLICTLKTTEELHLTVCGVEQCEPEHSFGPVARQDHHLHFILSGRGTLEIEGKTYQLHRGQIFLVPAGIETYYYADKYQPWQYAWVSFAGTNSWTYLEKGGLTADNPVRDAYIEPEAFLTIIEKILDHHALTFENELKRLSLLLELLSLLAATEQHGDEHSQKHYDYSADIYVENAVQYIHYNYNRIRVTDIAEFIGISKSYLSHIFKEKMQISLQEYLIRFRLEQGCRLLRSTNLPIKVIAEKVGYDNPLTFSKIFKNVHGISPLKYREDCRNQKKT